MRSRKLSDGAVGLVFFLGALCWVPEPAAEVRAAGLLVEICCLGGARAVMDGRPVLLAGLLLSDSCLAREAAVGAVKCEDMLAALVGSRLLAAAAGLTEPDSRLSRAEDDAVGAVRELRLALRFMDLGAPSGERGDLVEEDDFLSEVGDFKLFSDAFCGEPVETGSGLWLLRGLMGDFF